MSLGGPGFAAFLPAVMLRGACTWSASASSQTMWSGETLCLSLLLKPAPSSPKETGPGLAYCRITKNHWWAEVLLKALRTQPLQLRPSQLRNIFVSIVFPREVKKRTRRHSTESRMRLSTRWGLPVCPRLLIVFLAANQSHQHRYLAPWGGAKSYPTMLPGYIARRLFLLAPPCIYIS